MKDNGKRSLSDIKKLINKVQFEDLTIIDKVEKILVQNRGYVFKMPPPNTPVILLMSGGLDSVSMACFLMEKFKLKLYPLFINWGQSNLKKEERALDFFTSLYLKRYPKLFNKPKKITAFIPIKELNNGLKDIVILRNSIFASHAVHYASVLNEKDKLKINTIFCNSVASDGMLVPDSTLTAIRLNNLNICINEGDFKWQYTSIALEKTMGFYLSKDFFVRFALKNKIPIEKTWSCYRKTNIHCGKCLPCQGRKEAFLKAGIEDKTFYYRPKLFDRFLNKIRKIII